MGQQDKRLQLRLPADLADELSRLARLEGTDRSTLLRRLARSYAVAEQTEAYHKGLATADPCPYEEGSVKAESFHEGRLERVRSPGLRRAAESDG